MSNATLNIAGTEYFPTLTDAYQFYAGWEYSKAEVDKKIRRKEIQIKKPFIPAGKSLVIIDSHYFLK